LKEARPKSHFLTSLIFVCGHLSDDISHKWRTRWTCGGFGQTELVGGRKIELVLYVAHPHQVTCPPNHFAFSRSLKARFELEFRRAPENINRPKRGATRGDIDDVAPHRAHATTEDNLRSQERAATRGMPALNAQRILMGLGHGFGAVGAVTGSTVLAPKFDPEALDHSG
jgi:hypothetical protein